MSYWIFPSLLPRSQRYIYINSVIKKDAIIVIEEPPHYALARTVDSCWGWSIAILCCHVSSVRWERAMARLWGGSAPMDGYNKSKRALTFIMSIWNHYLLCRGWPERKFTLIFYGKGEVTQESDKYKIAMLVSSRWLFGEAVRSQLGPPLSLFVEAKTNKPTKSHESLQKKHS